MGKTGALSVAERRAVTKRVLGAKVNADATGMRGSRSLRDYQRAAVEFTAFLEWWNVKWEDVGPQDVLVYLRDWVPRHQCAQGPWAPSTLRARVSNLSSVFKLLGRGDKWDTVLNAGNPVLATEVSEEMNTYQRQCQAGGWAPRSAVPISRGAMCLVLAEVRRQTEVARLQRDSLAVLGHGRDIVLLVWLWHSSRRGADLLALEWEQVWVQSAAQTAVSVWEAGGEVQGLRVTPSRVKNSGRARPATIMLERQAEPEQCPVAVLHGWWQQLRRAGEATTGPIFCCFNRRTIPPGGRPAQSASGFGHRFKQLMAQCAQPGTVHGIRRGRLQECQSQGGTTEELKALSAITTESVLAVYLDQGRHLPVYAPAADVSMLDQRA